MEEKVKKTGLARFPAWALSLIILVALVILLIILNDPKSTSLSTIQIIGLIFYVILVTVGCFIICRTHPKSVWHTPFICNAVGILGLISNIILTIAMPDYSIPASEWIILVSSFILSVMGAFIGARMGRKKIDQAL